METPAETLSRLTNNEPLPCCVLAPEGVTHYLHRISWIEQMLLDATVHNFIELARERGLGEPATRMLIYQISAIGTIQASLRTTADPSSPLVFPSLPTAFEALRNEPKKVSEVDSMYVNRFMVSEDEKKS